MAFHILRKRTRRTVGTLAAVFFTGFIIFGFIDSFIKIKNSQIKKVDLVEVSIIAGKPAADAILYEAVSTEQCIKQLTFFRFFSSLSNWTQFLKYDKRNIQKSAFKSDPSTILISSSSFLNRISFPK